MPSMSASLRSRIASTASKPWRRQADASISEGYTTIRHRDLETRYLYRDAVTSVRGVDLKMTSGFRVGYVMGVGDDVPTGLAQLGVDVQLLGEQDLATGDLSRVQRHHDGHARVRRS